jgi:hypothetical protein
MVFRSPPMTSLAFQDFAPTLLASSGEYEGIERVVARANAWVQDRGVAVINAETIVVPAPEREPVNSGAAFRASGTPWIQVVRVWFRPVGPL